MPPSKEVAWASNEIMDGKALCWLSQCKRLENAKWFVFMTRWGLTMLFTVWECEWGKNVLSKVPGTRQRFLVPCWHCFWFSLWVLNIFPLTWQLQSPLVKFLVVCSLSFLVPLPPCTRACTHLHLRETCAYPFFVVISKWPVAPSVYRRASLLGYCAPGALQGNPRWVDFRD